MPPVHLITNLLKTALDNACMDEDCGDEYQCGLHKEGGDEASAAEEAIVTTEAWEGVAANEEEEDGTERLGPAVGAGGRVIVGRSKAEEHGVAYLDD